MFSLHPLGGPEITLEDLACIPGSGGVLHAGDAGKKKLDGRLTSAADATKHDVSLTRRCHLQTNLAAFIGGSGRHRQQHTPAPAPILRRPQARRSPMGRSLHAKPSSTSAIGREPDVIAVAVAVAV